MLPTALNTIVLVYAVLGLLTAIAIGGLYDYLRMRRLNKRLARHKAREQALLLSHKPPPGFTRLAKPHEIINGPEFVIYFPGMQYPGTDGKPVVLKRVAKPYDNWLLCGGKGENFRCRPTDIIFKKSR